MYIFQMLSHESLSQPKTQSLLPTQPPKPDCYFQRFCTRLRSFGSDRGRRQPLSAEVAATPAGITSLFIYIFHFSLWSWSICSLGHSKASLEAHKPRRWVLGRVKSPKNSIVAVSSLWPTKTFEHQKYEIDLWEPAFGFWGLLKLGLSLR